jgi:hypothetical protein
MKFGQDVKIVPVIQPAAIVDAASFTTIEIDTRGYSEADIYIQIGALDIAVGAMKLQESDTTGSGFTDITGGDYSGALPSATDDNKFYAWHVPLLGGRKRFLKVVLTGGDGSAGTYASGFAILSRASEHASTAATRGLAAEKFIA